MSAFKGRRSTSVLVRLNNPLSALLSYNARGGVLVQVERGREYGKGGSDEKCKVYVGI